MRTRIVVLGLALGVLARPLEAQWRDPRLLAGQVGFHVAASFFGKWLLHDEPPGRAIRRALVEGAASGLVAHTGYAIAGRHPHAALLGKTLAQKSTLMTRRSIESDDVLGRSLYTEWALTHGLVHVEWSGKARVELDLINAAVSTYYLFADDFDFDMGRTLYSGSLFFRNVGAAGAVRGFYAPGVIWVRDGEDDPSVLGHEIVHSLQAERGAAVAEASFWKLRVNFLVLSTGAPALLEGWPEHDRRLHEREADRYSGRP